jgi:uncharacterized UBP type Zn finger protein
MWGPLVGGDAALKRFDFQDAAEFIIHLLNRLKDRRMLQHLPHIFEFDARNAVRACRTKIWHAEHTTRL